MEDQFRLNLFRLADRLHKTVTELEEMPYTEYLEWVVFYKIEAESSG